MIYIVNKMHFRIPFTLYSDLTFICAVHSNSGFPYEIMSVGTIWKGYCGNRRGRGVGLESKDAMTTFFGFPRKHWLLWELHQSGPN
jgi:hypothetical protein